ncbi:Rne/Rng family ribonuclease [Sphingomonas nostoxanthinifaciens]|uniref:Rne/Rng family ribonuclease n=1 Tax=Sphingomonas nostoxanthinifaciens TaxID=2872652 RepID=UPI001CC206F1|nr:ribonuclease E/G [Sphingomonas nostoxanthinifaciens]UAK23979.1 ribonuclease E/G [Sphingomonas nostoxanthinifaciens]
MSTRMLIDARHREETRVAVVKGNRIEEFDFESEEHKQLKGNIYLAKVTRVEPSLQAAFVDYGGNRHGFLAFSEIHPDYYQIPKEDREALLREEAEHAAEEEALRAREDDDDDDVDAIERLDDDGARETLDAAEDYEDEHGDEDSPAPKPVSTGGGDDGAAESLRQKRMSLRRRYKIQDVIRRRQVLLVQVVKEERGNKGAALTTYLSLAGRYCVLMPNTSHGGGISRKISNAADRKRLKSILANLNLPNTMGCIVRTAGLQRTTQEIRRDFDYLARLWDDIREATLGSTAPAEIYRDSDLVKRAIRDIYSKDIDEVIVEGEDGYRAARNFMKLLMPAHARKIAPYSDAVPLFQRYGVEDQLAAMYQPVVQLKSGGYIVINPTEALVSIDINSGRSTREHNIEQTATATNLEAAQEIARQLRLRDMAGLVVIDFIDMENGSNNRKVEKAMKEALKNDRARIQVGRISSFGLFEMSRQRLRTGMLEASTRLCPHCEGTGFIRTASSSGLQALRLLEEEAARGRGSHLVLRASQEAVLYVLNRKRAELADIEERYGVVIEIISDGRPEGARMAVEASGMPPSHAPRLPQPIVPEPDDDIVDEIEDEEDEEAAAPEQREERAAEGGEDGEGRRRRRRRRRRGGRRDAVEGEASNEDGEAASDDDGVEDMAPVEADAETEAGEPVEVVTGQEERPRRGRRGRRGGRRDRGGAAEAVEAEAAPAAEPVEVVAPEPVAEAEPVVEAAPVAEEAAPTARRRPRARKAAAEAPVAEPLVEAAPAPVVETPVAEPAVAEEAPKPRRGRRKAAAAPVSEEAVEPAPVAAPAPTRRRRAAAAVAEPVVAPEAEPVEAPVEAVAAPDAAEDASGEAPRRGWWQRTFGA